jgi:hypothetical protein
MGFKIQPLCPEIFGMKKVKEQLEKRRKRKNDSNSLE